MSILVSELREIGQFFRRNSREMVVICAATLFLILQRYHPVGPRYASQFFYFAVLPLLTIVIVLRKNPLDFGLRPGNFRIWGVHVGVTIVIAFVLLYSASHIPSISGYYAKRGFNLLTYTVKISVILLSWEFLFRGFLLFGLKDKLREASILVQMVPFALLHIGKPEAETISCIVTGIYFGYVSYRGNSYWPACIMHLFINIAYVLLVNR